MSEEDPEGKGNRTAKKQVRGPGTKQSAPRNVDSDDQSQKSGSGNGDESGDDAKAYQAAANADGGDLESQVSAIVSQAVGRKATLMEEKLKYWHE